MTKKIGVAEAKKGFSEIISRIVYKGERFVLERKGKSMAAIVSIKDLERFEEVHGEEIKKWLSLGSGLAITHFHSILFIALLTVE